MINVGDSIPECDLRLIDEKGIRKINTNDFINKTIIIVGVPGAFTPTCHNDHIPKFAKKSEEIKNDYNIDEIYCIANNDPHVMEAWRNSFINTKLKFLSDGNSDFLRRSGLAKDCKSSFMGERFKRFIFIIKDNILENLLIDETGLLNTSFENMLDILSKDIH